MALFNLTGISLTNNQKTRSGATGPLVGGKYESNIYRYPQDIGNYDKGHYMVIHINEQVHTNYKGDLTGDDPTVIANRKRYGTPTLNSAADQIVKNQQVSDMVGSIGTALSKGISSGVDLAKEYFPSAKDALNATTGAAGVVANDVKQAAKNFTSSNGIRTIRRTTDTIALYMPDTLAFTHQQGYSEPSQQGAVAAGLSVGASLAQSLKKSTNNPAEFGAALASNMTPFMASLGLERLGGFGETAFAAGFGVVKNPMIELLYSAPSFREFRFDFMLYPRSEKEAGEVQRILNRLKFHQAPELRKEFSSYFLVPPSEFDIKFYYNGAINPNIPEISTCVLTSIDLDYAPNGFAAYEVPGVNTGVVGSTGMPVAIRLSLQFKETEIMTKANFAKTKHDSELKKLGVTEQDFVTGANGMGNYGE